MSPGGKSQNFCTSKKVPKCHLFLSKMQEFDCYLILIVNLRCTLKLSRRAGRTVIVSSWFFVLWRARTAPAPLFFGVSENRKVLRNRDIFSCHLSLKNFVSRRYKMAADDVIADVRHSWKWTKPSQIVPTRILFEMRSKGWNKNFICQIWQ